MNRCLLFLMCCAVVLSSGYCYTADDFIKNSTTVYADFGRGHMDIQLCNPTIATLNVNSSWLSAYGINVNGKFKTASFNETSFSLGSSACKVVRLSVTYDMKYTNETASVSIDIVPQIKVAGTTYNQTKLAWFNTSWSKRQPLTLYTELGTWNNYTVPIPVTYDSDMNTSFEDIRFIDTDNTTILANWINNFTASTSANFWINVSLTNATNKTIYMYYGNPTATNISNISTVFVETNAHGLTQDQNYENRAERRGMLILTTLPIYIAKIKLPPITTSNRTFVSNGSFTGGVYGTLLNISDVYATAWTDSTNTSTFDVPYLMENNTYYLLSADKGGVTHTTTDGYPAGVYPVSKGGATWVSAMNWNLDLNNGWDFEIQSFTYGRSANASLYWGDEGFLDVPNITYYNLTPVYPLSTGDILYANATCLDNTHSTLTAYVNWFKNGVYNATNGGYTVNNNTNTYIDSYDPPFTAYDNWTVEIWCGDGEVNTTHYNVTRMIYPYFVVNAISPTGYLPDGYVYNVSSIWLNLSTSYPVSACWWSTNATVNTSLALKNTTWFANLTTFADGNYTFNGWCNDSVNHILSIDAPYNFSVLYVAPETTTTASEVSYLVVDLGDIPSWLWYVLILIGGAIGIYLIREY